MCLSVFVASDVELPLLPYDDASPAFSTYALHEGDESVRRLTSKPYVYEVAALSDCCGCGFSYDINELAESTRAGVPDEAKRQARADYDDRQEAVTRLRQYLAAAVETGPVEVLCGWSGWVDPNHDAPIYVTPSYFGGESFRLEEKQYLIVSASAARGKNAE
jgi:hypothetical protein